MKTRKPQKNRFIYKYIQQATLNWIGVQLCEGRHTHMCCLCLTNVRHCKICVQQNQFYAVSFNITY